MQAGNSVSEKQDCAVVIIGGGPCGLTLAIELGRRGVSVILLEEKTSPARFPAANATQARTMEHYRRLGFAEKVRAQGLPPDYPTDIAYFTRYTRHELARFSLPSARAAREMVRTLTGSWSAAELPHRVSQMFVEDVLRAEASACPTVSIRPGWKMAAVRDTGTGVEVDAEHDGGRTTLRAAYAMGADGGSSPTRKALGYAYVGESGAVRDFMGGRMFAIHFPQRRPLSRHPASARLDVLGGEPGPARLHGERQRSGPVQLPHPAQARGVDERITDARGQGDVRGGIRRPARHRDHRPLGLERRLHAGGGEIPARPHLPRRRRRASVHPGRRAWLQHRRRGCGQSRLEACRRAQGLGRARSPRHLRNRATGDRPAQHGLRTRLCQFARAVRPAAGAGNAGPAGEAARKLTGDHFNHHARFEFNIPGITFGGRYDGSPIVVSDGTATPTDAANSYSRRLCRAVARRIWLADGRSLYDALGFEFTLLQLGGKPAEPRRRARPRRSASRCRSHR